MVSSEPIFEFNIGGWPPIRRYRKKEQHIKAEIVTAAATVRVAAEARPESISSNLLRTETNPEPVPLPEPVIRPSSSSSVISSVSLMNPYPIALPTPIQEPPISPFPLSFSSAPLIRAAFQQIASPTPSPPPVRSHSANSVQNFAGAQIFALNLTNANNNASGFPQSMGQVPLQSFSSWQTPSSSNQISSFPQQLSMGGPRSSPISQVSEFPPLYSLPPTFWEPVIRLPEPTTVPPTSAPPTPSLQELASREDGKGENFTDDVLKAIIIKAQPHHTYDTIAHLTRAQLIKHVDDLVAWWKTAHPQQAATTLPPPEQTSPSQQRQQHVVSPRAQQPLTPAVQASTASAAAAAKAQEKVIGQCPCCCDAQQNAAFAPCGHLYACTTCAHRLYDSGRGKCPVCRVPIQTYLKIYPTN